MPESPQLTEREVAEIEARASAASPGPVEARLGSGNYVCTALASAAPATFDEFVCDVLPDYACKPGLAPRWEANRDFIKHAYVDIPALIRDWRALRARVEALTTDWCECGHSRDKHQFFSDHDECYECDQASPDLCCEWRPAPRPNENAALREQLAQTENERDAAMETLHAMTEAQAIANRKRAL